jgi:hypothetical protein
MDERAQKAGFFFFKFSNIWAHSTQFFLEIIKKVLEKSDEKSGIEYRFLTFHATLPRVTKM